MSNQIWDITYWPIWLCLGANHYTFFERGGGIIPPKIIYQIEGWEGWVGGGGESVKLNIEFLKNKNNNSLLKQIINTNPLFFHSNILMVCPLQFTVFRHEIVVTFLMVHLHFPVHKTLHKIWANMSAIFWCTLCTQENHLI